MLHESFFVVTNWLFGVPALLGISLYVFGVYRSNQNKRLRQWSHLRVVFWISGTIISASALIGPLAVLSHAHFTWHMVGHLFLGMLGPLLMALGAPMTLLLRALPVQQARGVSRFLRSEFARFYIHPVTAAMLNIGGLWLLYTTDLFTFMHNHLWLYVLVHIQMFAAGYLFTMSMLYIDPVSRRFSYRFRTVVFIFALAGHGILSKFLYAYPPQGVPVEEARLGAMLMYYGGDAVDLVIIFLLFRGWYLSASARQPIVPAADPL